MHYMHGSPFDQDYDRDMKLPFKTTGDVFSFFPITADTMPAELNMPLPPIGISPVNKIPTPQDLGTPPAQSIWQPPRTIV